MDTVLESIQEKALKAYVNLEREELSQTMLEMKRLAEEFAKANVSDKALAFMVIDEMRKYGEKRAQVLEEACALFKATEACRRAAA